MQTTKYILIVEDEVLIAKQIKRHIINQGYQCSGIAIDYNGAVDILNHQKVDMSLLDININGKRDGLDLAAHINTYFGIPFMFLTSYNDAETLDQLKQLKPMGYINKPINDTTLLTTIDLFFSSQKKQLTKNLSIKLGSKVYNLNLADLIYIETEHVYIKLHFVNYEKLIRSSLSNFLELIPKNTLIQINRSTAVNPNFIEEIGKSSVKLKQQKFKLSSHYKNTFDTIDFITKLP
mgnify:CR=1 FL=1